VTIFITDVYWFGPNIFSQTSHNFTFHTSLGIILELPFNFCHESTDENFLSHFYLYKSIYIDNSNNFYILRHKFLWCRLKGQWQSTNSCITCAYCMTSSLPHLSSVWMLFSPACCSKAWRQTHHNNLDLTCLITDMETSSCNTKVWTEFDEHMVWGWA
jgi:hypothetical protein